MDTLFWGLLSFIGIVFMLGMLGRVLMPDEPPLTLKFWGNTLAVAAVIGIILLGVKACMEKPSRGGSSGDAYDRDPFGR